MTDPVIRPFTELREHGLLWLINRTVFHPRGFAMGVQVDDDGQVIGWTIQGDGTEPWMYAETIDEDGLFKAAEAFFGSLQPEET